ncbi:MAG: ABC transporter substrate-binding protein [Puniceicoccales bacterium]|jgi:polar amino acid transport system substrate-binding protein|nr:ABC transporter substrate-binding protein [Puniceicoccales bacterium]
MKKFVFIAMLAAFLSSCGNGNDGKILKFGTCADYPPFEYYKDGVLDGFEIDLVKIIARNMGKEVVFEDMAFSTLLASLDNDFINVVFAGYGSSAEKREKYDFSLPYYPERMVFVYKKSNPITDETQLAGKKIAYQLGSTAAKKWIEETIADVELVPLDKMDLAIESLKAGHVEYVVIDEFVANVYCEKNFDLGYFVPDSLKLSDGIAMAVKKGSPLTAQINKILKDLESSGELQKLREKWGLKQKWRLPDGSNL